MSFKVSDRIIRRTKKPQAVVVGLAAVSAHWGCSPEALAACILERGLKYYWQEALDEGGIIFADIASLAETEDATETG